MLKIRWDDMAKSKRKTGIIIITIFILILVAVIIFICRCIALAFTDNIKDKYTLNEKSENTFLKTLLVGASFGKEFEISEAELNTYINKKYCTDYDRNNSGADHIMVYLHEEEPAEIYAHIYIKGLQLAVRSKVEFSLDKETSVISARFYDAYVGELGIPDSILSYILSRVSENKDNMSVSGTAISIVAKYTYEIKDYDIDLYIKNFVPSERKVMCQTNSLTGQALKVAGEYITSDEGREALSGIYNRIKDKVTSWFS